MKSAFRALFAMVVLFCAVGLLFAADEQAEPKSKKPAKSKKAPAAALFRIPKQLQLAADQQAKVKELIEQFNPRMSELQAKEEQIVTPEQVQVRQEALRKAKDAGKKGKAARAEVEAALKISAEQKRQLAELNKARQALQQEAREALMSVLTDEQKSQLPKKGAKKPKDQADKKGESKKTTKQGDNAQKE